LHRLRLTLEAGSDAAKLVDARLRRAVTALRREDGAKG
jgi:hypothetical protein